MAIAMAIRDPSCIDGLTLRLLDRNEFELIWTIDRREIIEHIYRRQDGQLVRVPDYFDVRGWRPSTIEHSMPEFHTVYERGGEFWGAFDGATLVGIAILDGKWIRPEQDTLQLVFLHVSHAYRDRGVGRLLFEHAAARARLAGARRIYISATPSAHTVHFYLHRGCVVTPEPDPELYALEPEDIHFELML